MLQVRDDRKARVVDDFDGIREEERSIYPCHVEVAQPSRRRGCPLLVDPRLAIRIAVSPRTRHRSARSVSTGGPCRTWPPSCRMLSWPRSKAPLRAPGGCRARWVDGHVVLARRLETPRFTASRRTRRATTCTRSGCTQPRGARRRGRRLAGSGARRRHAAASGGPTSPGSASVPRVEQRHASGGAMDGDPGWRHERGQRSRPNRRPAFPSGRDVLPPRVGDVEPLGALCRHLANREGRFMNFTAPPTRAEAVGRRARRTSATGQPTNRAGTVSGPRAHQPRTARGRRWLAAIGAAVRIAPLVLNP